MSRAQRMSEVESRLAGNESYRLIAGALNTTIGSIAGFCNRNDLRSTGRSGPAKVARPVTRLKRVVPIVQDAVPEQKAEKFGQVLFVERRPNQCPNPLWSRWPGVETAMVCGAQKCPEDTFCERCKAIVYDRLPKAAGQ